MALYDFIAATRRQGLAKANRFTVYFPAPTGLATNPAFSPLLLRTIQLYCSRVNLPSISLSTAPIRTTGEVRNIPYERNFETFEMSFYADKNMNAKYLFDEWINLVQDRETRNFGYFDSYAVPSMSVTMEDINNVGQYRVYLMEVYPKTVSSVNLDHENSGIVEITVSFEYRYWKSIKLVNGLEPPVLPAGIASVGFANIQGILSGAYGVVVPNIAAASSSIFGGIVNGITSSIDSIGSSIGNILASVPPSLIDAGNTALALSMSGQAKGFSVSMTNNGIQLATPAGVNISAGNNTTISGQLGALRGMVSSNGAIQTAINLFTPNTVVGISTQLGMINGHLNNIGTSVGVVTNSISASILTSANRTNIGVALNGPKG